MKIVFISNYFSHHQRALSDSLAARAEYFFLATEPVAQERLAMGWSAEGEPAYVLHSDREPERAQELLKQADVVIVGSAPEHLVRPCIVRGQLVLRYSERPLKQGPEWKKYLPRLLRWHWRNPMGKPVYLLCASGYTAADYAKFGLFRGKAFRWGYFPEAKHYEDPDGLLAKKAPATLLWAGRFLDWKHPDDAIRLAGRLKEEGIPFRLDIIGRGPMEQTLRELIDQWDLQDRVHLLGSMPPEEVRAHMEKARIFLFTSDRAEGWGVVLNEAMNSGCAVVAGDAIGAVPYLVKNGENGCVYPSGDTDGLYHCVRRLLEDPETMDQLGRNGYRTVTGLWSARTAAQRLISLCEALLAGTDAKGLFAEGPCSPAPILGEDWNRK